MSDDDFIHDPVETGFDQITATVKGGGLSPAGYEAAKAMLAIPADKVTPPQLVALARALALDLDSQDQTIKNAGLTNAQFEFLALHNEFFKNIILQQAKEWQGVGGTKDRLRMQALAGLEAQLPVLASRMGKQTEKLADAVEAAKLFAKMGGIDGPDERTGPGAEGFTISIDLGADTRLTIGPLPVPQEGAEAAVSSQPQTITQGKINGS